MKKAQFQIARTHILEKEEKLIVFNVDAVNPLCVSHGAQTVKELLKSLREKGSFSKEYVDLLHPGFFEMLEAHNLIAAQDTATQNCPRPENDCACCGTRAASKSVYLLLTHKCNQKCVYCLDGVESYHKESPGRMDFDTARASLQLVYGQIVDGGYLEIVFFGGEPLLNWKLAKQIIQYIETDLNVSARIRIHYHLTTNLTVFPVDLIEISLKYDISYLVDVDGPEAVHNVLRPLRSGRGSFAVTARNLQKLKDAGIVFSLRATITKLNQDLEAVTRTHKELGGVSSALVAMSPVDSDMLPFQERLIPDPDAYAAGLKDLFRKAVFEPRNFFPFSEFLSRFHPNTQMTHGCGAPYGNTPVVTADGSFYSCIYLVGSDQYKTGSIHHPDLPVYEENLRRMRELVSIDVRPDCRVCPYRKLCGGGCPVGTLSVARNPNLSQTVKEYSARMACTTAKTVIEELFWYLSTQLPDS